MVVRMKIEDNWENVWKEVILNKNVVTFESEWKNCDYQIINIRNDLVLKFNGIYIHGIIIEYKYQFENFFNRCKVFINLIENLKVK